MNAFNVTGVAVVTGGASGIGKEAGFSFAEAGARGVCFADLNLDLAQDAVEESKRWAKNPDFRAIAVKVDVTDEMSVQNMVDRTLEEFGRIDYAVNSAGVSISERERSYDTTTAEFDRCHNINVKGSFNCTRAVSKAMTTQEPLSFFSPRSGTRNLGRGSIVNLGSVNSFLAAPKSLPYVTSKFAVMGLTKSAAFDCRLEDIRVNAVCPSFVGTPMVEKALEKTTPEYFRRNCGPIGRMAVPEEVAGMIIYLCSPAASYITGQGFVVDAGKTLT